MNDGSLVTALPAGRNAPRHEAADPLLPWLAHYAPRVAGITGSPIDRSIGLVQRAPRDLVAFSIGAPAADALPQRALAAAAAAALADDPVGALSYGPTEGESALRAALLAWLNAGGETVAEDELLVTAGGTQGLDLVCKLFVGAGDLVVAETPTYSNAIAIIASYEGEILRCPMDDDGLLVDRLPALIGKTKPKLIYVNPTYQNPSGTTLSLARRRSLLRLAQEWDAIVLEDDPYALLGFGAPPPPSLWSMDEARSRVVSVRTFSKILAPGLRVGWMQAPATILARMVAAKQGLDTCTGVLGQRLVAGFLAEGQMEAHLVRLRQEYRRRRDAMVEALRRHFGNLPGVSWTEPDGGFFLWLTLPAGTAVERLFPLALEEGVAFIPGTAFRAPGEGANELRLCFAHPPPAAIETGIARLKRAYDRL
jgi:2-aminoadipate transaminase